MTVQAGYLKTAPFDGNKELVEYSTLRQYCINNHGCSEIGAAQIIRQLIEDGKLIGLDGSCSVRFLLRSDYVMEDKFQKRQRALQNTWLYAPSLNSRCAIEESRENDKAAVLQKDFYEGRYLDAHPNLKRKNKRPRI